MTKLSQTKDCFCFHSSTMVILFSCPPFFNANSDKILIEKH